MRGFCPECGRQHAADAIVLIMTHRQIDVTICPGPSETKSLAGRHWSAKRPFFAQSFAVYPICHEVYHPVSEGHAGCEDIVIPAPRPFSSPRVRVVINFYGSFRRSSQAGTSDCHREFLVTWLLSGTAANRCDDVGQGRIAHNAPVLCLCCCRMIIIFCHIICVAKDAITC